MPWPRPFSRGRKILQGRGHDRGPGPCQFHLQRRLFRLPAGRLRFPGPYRHDLQPALLPAAGRKAGYAKAKDLYAWYLSAQADPPERIVKIAERTMKRERITIRPLNMKRLYEDANILKELYNKIWEKNWGFVPMTDEEFNYQVKKLKDIVWPDFVVFAEVDGKAIGFNLVVPDVNQALIKMDGELFSWRDPFALVKFLTTKFDDTREMAMGVLPEYRKKGLEAMLYLEALKTGKKRKIKGGELSWTLEDNEGINNGIAAMGGKIIKKYRIYEKNLTFFSQKAGFPLGTGLFLLLYLYICHFPLPYLRINSFMTHRSVGVVTNA